LLAVGLTAICARILPFKLPLPLLQIAIGSGLAWPGFNLHVTFNPDLFMLLFIPPLLFADGWRIPKREFFMQRRAILMLALGLVFMTVVAIGYFVHLILPSIPLPVAFALAAVLSPTDAVALSGVAGKGTVPGHLMHILEGEALMNDASGLVALKFAIIAALTGVFSLRDASISFAVIAAGGLAVGAAIGWVAIALLSRMMKWAEDDDPAAGVIMTLLVPFAGYLLAEHAGCSGILAAVAAGMMMNQRSLNSSVPTIVRIRLASTWSMIEFVFNGLMFILLGLQLPHIIGTAVLHAHAEGNGHVWLLFGYVVAVMVALHALRFAWVWLLRWQASRRAAANGVPNAVPGIRTVSVMTLGGVRGAVTLAGILSLPVALPDGAPLPGRDLAIFLASGTILMSLLVGVVGLPLTLRGIKRAPDRFAAEERLARRAAAQAAVRALEDKRDPLLTGLDHVESSRAADSFEHVMHVYSRQADVAVDDQSVRQRIFQGEFMETELRMTALQAQREELLKLRRSQKINDETHSKLLREIDLAEVAIVNRRKNLETAPYS
jgi:CPA1 family monovalent cation:H+ antiporter